MKKLKILLCLQLAITGALAQQTTVSGNMVVEKDTLLVMLYTSNKGSKTDTIIMKNGQFVWKPVMLEAQAVLGIFLPSRRSLQLYADHGNITITGTPTSPVIVGSNLHDEHLSYQKTTEDIRNSRSILYKKLEAATEAERVQIEFQIDSLRQLSQQRMYNYISTYPASAYSLKMLNDFSMRGGEYTELQPLFTSLDLKLQQGAVGQSTFKQLELLKHSALGEKIINFSQADLKGKQVSFSDFRGKYVLIDFWASWCKPCRAENPNVLKAFNTYKNKNFTVLGISLDAHEDRWKRAVEEDGMPWVQLSDLKGFRNEIARHYGINSIPMTFLVDPEGRIIAKGLRGKSLDKKLKELFD